MHAEEHIQAGIKWQRMNKTTKGLTVADENNEDMTGRTMMDSRQKASLSLTAGNMESTTCKNDKEKLKTANLVSYKRLKWPHKWPHEKEEDSGRLRLGQFKSNGLPNTGTIA